MTEPVIEKAVAVAVEVETVPETTWDNANMIGEYVRDHFGADTWLAWGANAGICILALVTLASLTAMILVYAERKVSARMQRRLGPTRTGPCGILQTLADGIKLFFKEGFKPKSADFFTYYLAPFLPMVASFLILTVIPFDKHLQVADPELGIIFVAAISGLAAFGLIIGSWGSNNKYALLSGMRSGAQIISYEVSLLLGMLLIVLVSGETSLQGIIESQSGNIVDWWIIKMPVVGFIAFIFFIIASTAELNRTPFDTVEAESELAGGFHVEYSGICFSMFFLAEYVNMLIAAALGVTLFLGGWHAPIESWNVAGFGWIWFTLKTSAILFAFIWFRWTFPRLRIDQMMDLEWKFLLPASLVNLLIAGVLLSLGWYFT
ncbi:MAG: NADH-quinone oxidoreductase subunit NuoH [Planctomycetes bacterium]|nr:NADH-quinone oxidoreductase subunit NuoH [Planctomycetota bacterium]